VSTAGAAGCFIRRTSFGAAFLTGARFGLALAVRFAAAFPREALALGRAVAPFLFLTLDDCFLRLAMIDPRSSWRSANALMLDQKTPPLSLDNPPQGLSTDDLSSGTTEGAARACFDVVNAANRAAIAH
jgi:hypothetical protein